MHFRFSFFGEDLIAPDQRKFNSYTLSSSSQIPLKIYVIDAVFSIIVACTMYIFLAHRMAARNWGSAYG